MNPNRLLLPVLATLLLAASTPPVLAQLPPVETREAQGALVVRGDFDGDGDQDIALVDKATGNYHVLIQDAAGAFSRQGPYATGISDVTGAAAGRVESAAFNSLLASSASANRIVTVRGIPAAGTSPVSRNLYLPSAIGPGVVAAGEENGSSALYEDLLVGSNFNSGPNVARASVERVGAALSVTPSSLEVSGTGSFTAATRAMVKSTLDHTIATVQRNGSGTHLRVISLGLAGTPQVFAILNAPHETNFAVAPFGASLGTAFRWISGDTGLWIHNLQEPSANSFSTLSMVSHVFAEPVRDVIVVPSSPTQNRLLVIFGDGSLIRTYTFTAPSTLTLLDEHTMPAGEGAFGAIGVPGNNGFHLLTGDLATGTISRSRRYQWNGTGFVEKQVIDGLGFGEINALTNVFIFSADPFVNQGALLLSRLTAGDWTSGTPPVPPGNVVVQAESFGGVSSGLGNPTSINLGSFPPASGFTLLSQYRGNISVFGLSKPGGVDYGDVSISPAPGTYKRTIQLRFSAPSGFSIYYRVSESDPWTAYADPGQQPSSQSDPAYATWLTSALPLMVFKTTTVQYFASSPAVKTPVRSATFTFTVPPDSLSSLEDGVPDYVKIGRGYNPFLQPPNGDVPGDTSESDDPQSYLQKLLFDAGYSIPNRNTTPGAYTLYVRPRSSDGVASFTAGSLQSGFPPLLADGTANNGTRITAHGFTGGALDSGETRPYSAAFTLPSVRFTHLASDPASPLFVCGTSPHFPIDAAVPTPPLSSSIGRELVSIEIAPTVTGTPYTRAYTGGSTATEANAWLAGAAGYYATATPPVYRTTIDSQSTGVALVFENWVQRRLVDRGVLPTAYDPALAGYLPANRVSLTPYRSSEGATPMPVQTNDSVGVISLSFADVTGLGEYQSPSEPGHDVPGVVETLDTALRTSADADIVALRTLVGEVYRLSAAYGNTYPGAFDAPIDALRAFILTGVLPLAYTRANPQLTPANWNIAPTAFTSLTSADYASATQGIADLLALLAPRPFADFDLVVRADTAGAECTLLDRYSLGGTYALFRGDGTAFRFPDNFDVIPGVRLTVRAYTDSSFTACAGTPLEVISVHGQTLALVTVIPAASVNDTDGNLLGDEWEQAFFGSKGNDAWAKPGGDGYTTLQKYLDQADPFVSASYSIQPAANLAIPEVIVSPGSPGQARLGLRWPSAYFGKLSFRIQSNTNLGNAAGWTDVVAPFLPNGDNAYEASVPHTGGTRFWRVLVSLP